jgi:acetyl-CoA carboxylase biotin carboxyl carrier protein
MIDIRKLKELVRLMVANELTELDLRDSEEHVTLRRQHTQDPPVIMTTPAAQQAIAAAVPAASATQDGAAMATAVAEPATDLREIVSPMVGTYYSAPNPDSDAFVSVGSSVGPDTVVCIIEAMKIFNEIKAEHSGTIEKILVKNGDSIEFGQPLFLVRPS